MKKWIAATLKFFHALFFIAIILFVGAFLISPLYDHLFCNNTAQLTPSNFLYYFFTYCQEWKPNPLKMKPYTGTIGYVISILVILLVLRKILEVIYKLIFKKPIKEELFVYENEEVKEIQ
jgi:hypothetical protein